MHSDGWFGKERTVGGAAQRFRNMQHGVTTDNELYRSENCRCLPSGMCDRGDRAFILLFVVAFGNEKMAGGLRY